MLTEVPFQTKYVVKVQGRVVSAPQASRNLAEAFILNLPVDQRSLAEVVPVSDQGKELLLG